jgi:phosphoribosylformylglycinamidine synthase
MYIDGDLRGPYGEARKVSGLPTLLFTVSSVVEDVSKCVTMDVKEPGDLVYVLGETKDELGGGEYYQLMGKTGLNVPKVDASALMPLYQSLHRAVSRGLLASAHAVTRGGLGVHLAITAMGGELGLEVDLAALPAKGASAPSRLLFSESAGRLIATVAPGDKEPFEELFSGMPAACIGEVTGTGRLVVRRGPGAPLMEETVEELKRAWLRPFGGLI